MVLAAAGLLKAAEKAPKAEAPAKTIPTVSGVNRPGGRLNDEIRLTIPGLRQWLAEDSTRTAELVLYVDHVALPGLQRGGVSPSKDEASFVLSMTPDTQKGWFTLLRRPQLAARQVTLGAGPKGAAEWHSAVNSWALTTIEEKWLWPWAAFFAFVTVLLIVLARKTDILRDSGDLPPAPPPGSRKSFSLARVQMAWWTLLVSGAFVFIFMVTWTNRIEPRVLALIGVSATTGLAAVAIDSTKAGEAKQRRDQLLAEQARLTALGAGATPEQTARLAQIPVDLRDVDRQIQAPVSKGFWVDLISDFHGPAISRFQMVLWTILLGVLFVIEVAWNLTMPAFDETLLALLGISAGTYVGFKFPERPSS